MDNEPNAVGTDDDSMLEKRLCKGFSGTKHLLGREHLKWSLDRQMELKHIPEPVMRTVRQDIFGPSEYADRPALLDCGDRQEYDRILRLLILKWSNQGSDATLFADWFLKRKSDRYFTKASRWAWESAGLTGPHWQQAQERMNRQLKSLRDKLSHINVLDSIDTVQRMIEDKEKEELRALQGIGQYRLVPSMRRFQVSTTEWHGMSDSERKDHVNKYLAAIIPRESETNRTSHVIQPTLDLGGKINLTGLDEHQPINSKKTLLTCRCRAPVVVLRLHPQTFFILRTTNHLFCSSW
jgi:hypothetical protein